MQLLGKLAKRAKLPEKIAGMYKGDHLNVTEDRAVLHVALRAKRDQVSELRAYCISCNMVASLWHHKH